MIEYIYGLKCPIDGNFKYIGKSKNPKTRFNSHIKKLDKKETPKKLWLQKLFKSNLLPILTILEKVDEGIDAREREQFFLTKHRATALNIHNPKKGAKSEKWDKHGIIKK